MFPGPPGVPVEFQVDDMTAVSVWLSWKPNVDGGFDQYFTVYYRPSCDNSTECMDFIKDTDIADPGLHVTVVHKVSGLNESTEYEFKVLAINSFTGTAGNNRSTDEELGKTLGKLILNRLQSFQNIMKLLVKFHRKPY